MSKATTLERLKLYERDVADWSDAELLAELEQTYAATVVPPCRVCGGELSIQSIGGGMPTIWRCQGLDEDGKRQEGRRIADEHYSKSTFEDRRAGGDSAVLELARRYRDK